MESALTTIGSTVSTSAGELLAALPAWAGYAIPIALVIFGVPVAFHFFKRMAH